MFVIEFLEDELNIVQIDPEEEAGVRKMHFKEDTEDTYLYPDQISQIRNLVEHYKKPQGKDPKSYWDYYTERSNPEYVELLEKLLTVQELQ